MRGIFKKIKQITDYFIPNHNAIKDVNETLLMKTKTHKVAGTDNTMIQEIINQIC